MVAPILKNRLNEKSRKMLILVFYILRPISVLPIRNVFHTLIFVLHMPDIAL